MKVLGGIGVKFGKRPELELEIEDCHESESLILYHKKLVIQVFIIKSLNHVGSNPSRKSEFYYRLRIDYELELSLSTTKKSAYIFNKLYKHAKRQNNLGEIYIWYTQC